MTLKDISEPIILSRRAKYARNAIKQMHLLEICLSRRHTLFVDCGHENGQVKTSYERRARDIYNVHLCITYTNVLRK